MDSPTSSFPADPRRPRLVTSSGQARNELLPFWIRAFSWFFLLFLGGVPLLFLFSVLTATPITLNLFGLSYYGSASSGPALIIQALMLIVGVSAYGLLWGRAWGITLAIVVGIVGLTIAVSVMVVTGFGAIPLDPLVQIPFLIKLFKIRDQWNRIGQA